MNGSSSGIVLAKPNDDDITHAEVATRRRPFLSQKSTVASRRQQAVCVRRAHKAYGSKKSPNIILDGLNMTVPKGTMYV